MLVLFIPYPITLTSQVCKHNLGLYIWGNHINRTFQTQSPGFLALPCTDRLVDLLRLPDRTIAKAIGIHQLRLRRAISIHDPDFSSIGKAV
jgi:hypothetical protein